MMQPLIISVSGCRGIVGDALTPEAAMNLGATYGKLLGQGKRVVIGRDTRPSGGMLQSAATAGLLAAGVNVTDLGVVTTPAVVVDLLQTGADGGLVVTASHNPAQYNGLKIMAADGRCLPAQKAAALKDAYLGRRFSTTGSGRPGKLASDATATTRHLKTVLQTCDRTLISSRRFRVVLDPVNGAGCLAGEEMLSKLGCEVIAVNAEPTGQFAHAPEPLAENLEGLCEAVRRHRAVVGFALDPAGDRLALVDEKGRYIGEEYTLPLVAGHLLSKRRGSVAANLSTSRMIDVVVREAGAVCHRTPVGETNVSLAVAEHGCVVGGEGSGGVIDPRVGPTRDAFVGMAQILDLLARQETPLSQLADGLGRFCMIKTKFGFPREEVSSLLAAVREAYVRERIDERDGIRIDREEGWVHVRPSNTEPIVRIIAEADDEPTARKFLSDMQKVADTVRG